MSAKEPEVEIEFDMGDDSASDRETRPDPTTSHQHRQSIPNSISCDLMAGSTANAADWHQANNDGGADASLVLAETHSHAPNDQRTTETSAMDQRKRSRQDNLEEEDEQRTPLKASKSEQTSDVASSRKKQIQQERDQEDMDDKREKRNMGQMQSTSEADSDSNYHDEEFDVKESKKNVYRTPRKLRKELQEAQREKDNEAFLRPEYEEVGVTRSGRKITKRKTTTTPVKKKPATPAKKVEKRMEEDDFCGICGEMEDEQLSDMVLCDGGCMGSYHLLCLGLEKPPQEKEWLCEQCRTNEQTCFLCNRVGTINERGGVYRCSVQGCGKAYHQACIDEDPLAIRLKKRPGSKNEPNANGETDEEVTDLSIEEQKQMERERLPFRCSRHVCHVCEETKRSNEFMRCLRCPNTFHAQCVSPSCRYNNVGLLCSKHPDDDLPRLPDYFFADQSTEAVTVVDRGLRIPMLFVPKAEPNAYKANDVHHFRLPVHFMTDLDKHPPVFRKLVKNIYTFKPPKVDLEDVPQCVCKDHCGDQCINRLSFTECFGPAPVPGAKWSKDVKDSNCNLGEHCGNRALHQRIYPRFQRFHTREKGWALRVLEDVKASTLVIEYVGEVINEEEKERRLMEHAKNTPEDKNMYIMELGKGTYIDARFKGSESRFINHSCDPNCHLLKWSVKGVDRIAITALRDIKAGEELSYDYQFHTRQALEWKCFCGSKNCRGTMAPEKINQRKQQEEAARKASSKKLSKKEMLLRDKKQIIQQRMHEHKEAKAALKRLTLTTQVSLGDFANSTLKSNVRVGPAPREFTLARAAHVFLPRNAMMGSDFLMRKHLRKRRLKEKRKARYAAAFDEASVSSGSKLEEESDLDLDTSSVETVETASSVDQTENGVEPLGTRDAPIELEESSSSELEMEVKQEEYQSSSVASPSKDVEEAIELEFDTDEGSNSTAAPLTEASKSADDQDKQRFDRNVVHSAMEADINQKLAMEVDDTNDLEFEVESKPTREEEQDIEFVVDSDSSLGSDQKKRSKTAHVGQAATTAGTQRTGTEQVNNKRRSRQWPRIAKPLVQQRARDVTSGKSSTAAQSGSVVDNRKSRQGWPRIAKPFLKRTNGHQQLQEVNCAAHGGGSSPDMEFDTGEDDVQNPQSPVHNGKHSQVSAKSGSKHDAMKKPNSLRMHSSASKANH